MSSGIPVTEAKLVGNFLATLLFGFHTIAFGFGLRCLLWSRSGGVKKGGVHWIMLWAGIIIWVLAALDVALSLYENISGFVLFDGSADEYFTLERWSGNLRGWIFLASTIVGDFIMIQRCWIVWNRWWLIIALPVLLIVAELGTGLTSLIWQLVIPPNELLTHTGEVLTAVSLATWAITCTLTVLTMILIILRIWSVERVSSRLLTTSSSTHSSGGSNALRYAMRIVMESGLFYAATMFTLLMVYAAGSNGAYPVTDIIPQVVGIAFNLIIVRATTHTEEQSTYSVSAAVPSFAVRMPRRDQSTTSGGRTSMGTDIEKYTGEHLEPRKKPSTYWT